MYMHNKVNDTMVKLPWHDDVRDVRVFWLNFPLKTIIYDQENRLIYHCLYLVKKIVKKLVGMAC